jgi:hypothetical protein
MLGRVVAGADVVIELSVLDAQQKEQKIQLPLKRAEGQWWLTNLEPNSEYLNWESSTNKIVSHADPLAFKSYLQKVKAGPSQ